MVTAGFMLALGILLPQLFGRVQVFGMTFLPMHLPVLICGAVCGGVYGAVCGALTPIICSLIFSMPPIYPTAVAMMFELCAYGVLIAVFYRRLHLNIYPALILAMVGGRVVNGLANLFLLGVKGQPYAMETFFTAAFIKGIPGMILQIVLVPIIVLVLQKAGFIDRERKVYA